LGCHVVCTTERAREIGRTLEAKPERDVCHGQVGVADQFACRFAQTQVADVGTQAALVLKQAIQRLARQL